MVTPNDDRLSRATTRERRERQAERRREWQESRARKAASARAALNQAREALPPMGEPVKIGHHSERRHRRALERFDRTQERVHEHERMERHHAAAAAAIEHELATAVYADDRDAQERLELRIAQLELRRERMKEINRSIRRARQAGRDLDEWAQEFAATAEEIEELKTHARIDRSVGYPSYALSNLGGRIQRARRRLAEATRARSTQTERTSE